MKKRVMVIGAGMAMVAAMLSSGCASALVVQGRNAELDRKAVQLAVTPNGGTAAIDLLGLKGYWQAWKAEPVKMTGATLLDAGTAAGAALLVNELTKDSGDSKPATPAVENNGGTVIINTGSGDTTYTTTTVGAAE